MTTFLQNTVAGGGGGGSFPTVTGLYARFRADLGVTKDGSNLVSTWADQSGNGHDLTSSLTKRPLWQTAQINGVPAILFDGVNDQLLQASVSLPEPFTMLLLYEEIVHTAGSLILSTSPDNSGTGAEFYMNIGNTAIVRPSFVGASVTIGTGIFALLTGIANGTSSTLALNDGTPQTNAADLSGTGTVISAGCRGNGFTPANVNIAEIVLMSGAVSPTDKTALLSYFQLTYGLW